MAGVAVVTGSGRGIGRAIALRLARAGLAVGVTDLVAAAAATVAAEIAAQGGRARGEAADVTDLGSVRAAVAAIEGDLGPVDVLVNNAGWDRMEPFLDNDPALWDRLIAVNLRGVLYATRAVLEGMVARGRGRVVNIASDAARVGSSGEAVYAACKAGVVGFSKALAREVVRQGVTVNVVCPGPTDTALLAELGTSTTGAKIIGGLARAIPMGRLGTPEDVAGAVAYFASAEAAYVTGQVLSVSGGLTMAG
ncbi:MAG: SDR family oxidoreductase [Candidatus Binatia bacterium]